MLTARQERLVAALLGTATARAACRRAGVAERTYRQWSQLPEFREAVRAAGRAATERAWTALQGLTTRAAATLARAMRGKATPVAVKAALGVLDRAGQLVTVHDLLARVEALEASQKCPPT
jgi:hypothetical protein